MKLRAIIMITNDVMDGMWCMTWTSWHPLQRVTKVWSHYSISQQNIVITQSQCVDKNHFGPKWEDKLGRMEQTMIARGGFSPHLHLDHTRWPIIAFDKTLYDQRWAFNYHYTQTPSSSINHKIIDWHVSKTLSYLILCLIISFCS